MPNRRPIEQRFWEKVERGSSENHCWSWKASKTVDGYGWLGDGDRGLTKAHRFSWKIHFGKVPHGLNVLHKCDNAQCANPLHLYLGTQRENNLDRAARGWRPIGELNSRAKISETDVAEIRKLVSLGISNKEIATKFNISKCSVCDIKFRRSWKHVA